MLFDMDATLLGAGKDYLGVVAFRIRVKLGL